VNATNRNSHLNIICIKLVTQVKNLKKPEIQTFLKVLGFLKPKKNLKFGLFEVYRLKKLKIADIFKNPLRQP